MLQSDWSRASELAEAPVPSKRPRIGNSDNSYTSFSHWRPLQVAQQNKGLSTFQHQCVYAQHCMPCILKLPCNLYTKTALVFAWEWSCQHIMAKFKHASKICLHGIAYSIWYKYILRTFHTFLQGICFQLNANWTRVLGMTSNICMWRIHTAISTNCNYVHTHSQKVKWFFKIIGHECVYVRLYFETACKLRFGWS